jgi:hypothetical protein
MILHEVQRVPGLLSCIQVEVDATPLLGQYIFTGSANFVLLESVSQSLAGRTALGSTEIVPEFKKHGSWRFDTAARHDDIVFEQDLGPDTLDRFRTMELYHPDPAWDPVAEE